MKSAPLPPDEPERLEALRASRILDTVREPAFDELAQLAAQICGVPIAAVTLVDSDRLWLKSGVGHEMLEIPRENTFCAHTILGDDIMEVPDTEADERFVDNPFVLATPRVRAYFGVPFKARSGHRLGALCVLDYVPRQLTAEQRKGLRALGRQVESQLDLRLRLLEADAAQRAIAAADRTLRSLLRAAVGLAVVGADADGKVTFLSKGAELLLGYPETELVGRVAMTELHDSDELTERLRELAVEGGPPPTPLEALAALAGEAADSRPWTLRRRDGAAVPVSLSVQTIVDEAGAAAGFTVVASDLTESRRDAEALLQSRHQFNASFESAAVASLIVDLNDTILRANQAFCDLIGYAEQELIGASPQSISHPDDAFVGPKWLDAMLQGQLHVRQVEKRYIHKLGHHVWVSLSAWLERDERQRPLFALVQAQDIAPRKRTEEALRREGEFRSAIVQSALDGIVVVDGAGAVLEFNPAAEAMFGWTRGEILGQDMFSRMMPARVRESYRDGLLRFLKTGESVVLNQRIQLPALRADGTEFPLELSTTFVHLGDEPRFVGFLRDMTAQRDAERMQAQNLRQSTLQADVGVAFTGGDALRDVLHRCIRAIAQQPEVALAGIWVRCPRSGQLQLQAAAGPCVVDEAEMEAHLQGLAAGTFAGEGSPSISGSLADAASPVDRAWAARAELETFVRYPLVRESGVVGAIVLLGRAPLAEAHEALASIADTIALGIEHKHGEVALQIAKEAAESAARTKSAFLANMSHELRTPLNAILGFGHLLAGQSYGKLNEMQSDFLNDVLVSGEHMLRLVSDLLELRRLEDGAGDLVPTWIHLHDAVETAAQRVSPLARKKAHTMTIALSEPLPEVIADPEAVVQILVNLLSNAIGFTPKGGAVGVRAHAEGAHVTLEVHDNGIGIALESQANLFDYFGQSGAKNDDEMNGSGVGLALTRALVRRLGGEISVTSAVGVGSVFRVKLRRAGTTQRPQPRASS